jgi:hypothetical protein
MSGQTVRSASASACAYCGKPLAFTAQGIEAWREGNLFFCNDFCADGICTPDAATSTPPANLRLS